MTPIYTAFVQHLGATRPEACKVVQQEYPAFMSTYGNQDNIVTMNAYWRYKLNTLPINTIEIRAYLRDDDNLTVEEWLLMFDNVVLPYVNHIYNIHNVMCH